jgi:signal transduction histidine kinase/CheY-like chemotaxis protein
VVRTLTLRTTLLAMVALGAALVAVTTERGAPGSLLPHGYCFTWNPSLLWTHVVSDTLIGLAYVSIPVTLLHLVRKRTDLPFNWIVVLFAIFIVSCGATHWIEVWTVWNPDYWLSATVKMVTAFASVLTSIALVGLVPRILAIPTVAQLTAARDALASEVATRRQIEDELRRERAALEERVRERTDELARATATAEAAHAAADEANKLKDHFLAKVSHELRTPLQSTLSWAQVIKVAGASDPERTAQATAHIVHNVRSQARLLEDLLDISRILSGKLRLELQLADATQVIEKAIGVVRSAAAGSAVTIDAAGDGSTAVIRTDPVRLEQIVWNLINNAVQASPDGGKVQVRWQVDATRLRVEVRDWGRGIDPRDLPHVFEPFRQCTGGSQRGLGLGLAIARSIVELFGGSLQATSEGLQRGATFTLELPVVAVDDDARDGEVVLGSAERAALAGLRVVYVEDEPEIGEAGRIMLASFGMRVDLCPTYADAARRIAAGDFDVLLSDLALDGGHRADELLDILHRSNAAAAPALVLSAHGSHHDRTASARNGFARHLVKPADWNEVARAIATLVRRVPVV